MRIITGSLKGRKLKSPKTNDVRPTSDKVKEAIFDMLYPWLRDGFVCMDVFAGSGNMGLEAISRGAGKVFFSDSSRESLALVRENVKICEAEDKAILLAGDFKANIKRVHEKVDIFFVDPPYANKMIPDVVRLIETTGNLNKDGVIVCEHSHKDVMPEKMCSFKAIKQKRYGAIGVTIYSREEASADNTENCQ